MAVSVAVPALPEVFPNEAEACGLVVVRRFQVFLKLLLLNNNFYF